ncbi:hypothetical protein Taro_006767 [Colocasia esculenta]|uniref:Ubiquitin-like protease family profile domain-containing protein n=1 Tax=Colocasia esculenta TaxID=4460 RepID=A0A843TYA4_COLES|nr:hypothetical protein [Colocasia esculenta]
MCKHLLNIIPKQKLEEFTYFDSLWFNLYVKGETDKVMGWIKKEEKKVFSHAYTFVPIVCWGHWNLLILCNFGKSIEDKHGPCMLSLDSLLIGDPNTTRKSGHSDRICDRIFRSQICLK